MLFKCLRVFAHLLSLLAITFGASLLSSAMPTAAIAALIGWVLAVSIPLITGFFFLEQRYSKDHE